MIDVRALTTREEFESAVELQKQIWHFDDVELLPVRLFVVASKIGGQLFGAFDGERLVGFSIGIPGIKPGSKPYIHSHMLGVVPGYRDRGVGRMIKLRQREDALARGIDLIEWTFDPLELKNAYFNIERVGAVVRRYILNQYGITTSRLHSGLPTDRCVAEWYVANPRVEERLNGVHTVAAPAEARVEVPLDIAEMRQADPRRARAVQERVSEQFVECFARGLTVTDFEAGSTSASYLFSRWESR